MRRFVLITAMVVASASAHAGPSRSLTIGASHQQVATTADQAKTADAATTPVASQTGAAPADQAKPTDTPKYIHRPLAVDTTTVGDSPRGDAAAKSARRTPGRQDYAAHAGYAARPGMMPYRRHHWNAGRVIAALHRYGIYW
jgi:hypothetical protein